MTDDEQPLVKARPTRWRTTGRAGCLIAAVVPLLAIVVPLASPNRYEFVRARTIDNNSGCKIDLEDFTRGRSKYFFLWIHEDVLEAPFDMRLEVRCDDLPSGQPRTVKLHIPGSSETLALGVNCGAGTDQTGACHIALPPKFIRHDAPTRFLLEIVKVEGRPSTSAAVDVSIQRSTHTWWHTIVNVT